MAHQRDSGGGSEGSVEALYLTDREGAPMQRVEEMRIVAGIGVAEDRLGRAATAAGSTVDPDKQVTLIESEACAAVAAAIGLPFSAAQSRRNIETRGMSLNPLVGRTFRIGAEVVLQGIEPCDPCAHLQKSTGLDGLVRAMTDRGGLRAVVVAGGVIREGDTIAAMD